MGDAAHLVLGIGHEVEALAATVVQCAARLLAKIHVAIEFAQDQQVNVARNFGAQGGERFEAGKHPRGAQVREQAERLAQAEDRLFGSQVPLEAVIASIAHRAEQDGIGGPCHFQRLIGAAGARGAHRRCRLRRPRRS